MRVTLDTNILIRAVMQDEEGQAAASARILREAELIAIPLSCLCEFVWVLRRIYRLPRERIAWAIRNLMDGGNVVTDRAATEAGLWLHDRGGDFADGIIEFEGRQMGAIAFASFDQKALRLLEHAGRATLLPE